MKKIVLIAAAALAIGLASPALAEPGKANPPGQDDGTPGNNGQGNAFGFGAPLPLAGAGLIALAGGAFFVRRLRKSATK
jgi:hypothetical protein